jgi:metal-responsive CopG/Arc/MetJ family transcriptional regulator
MKTVQVNIEDELLENVDKAIKEDGMTRSAFVRQALELALKRRKIREADEQYRRGYLKYPQQPEEYEIWQGKQVWPEE